MGKPTFLAVLLSLTFLNSSFAAFNRTSCPSWLNNYEEYHWRNRNSDNARYLIAVPHPAHGLGDRLRGMLFAARIAVATDRILLLAWENPGPITDYLVPSARIDWRVSGTPAQDIELPGDNVLATNATFGNKTIDDSELYNWKILQKYTEGDMQREIRSSVRKGLYFHSSKRFLIMQSNERSISDCEGCPYVGSTESRALVCLFNYLFKVSDEVDFRAQQQLAQLYPGHHVGHAYAAIHLRLGYLKGEARSINRFRGLASARDLLSGVLQAVSCGQELANKSGMIPSDIPIILLTDHSSLRSFAQKGKLAQVVAPSYGSLHIGTARGVEEEQHYSTFVDLALYAKAKCVMQSASGYSHIGWLLGGGTDYTMHIHKCLNLCTRDPDTSLCVRR